MGRVIAITRCTIGNRTVAAPITTRIHRVGIVISLRPVAISLPAPPARRGFSVIAPRAGRSVHRGGDRVAALLRLVVDRIHGQHRRGIAGHVPVVAVAKVVAQPGGRVPERDPLSSACCHRRAVGTGVFKLDGRPHRAAHGAAVDVTSAPKLTAQPDQVREGSAARRRGAPSPLTPQRTQPAVMRIASEIPRTGSRGSVLLRPPAPRVGTIASGPR